MVTAGSSLAADAGVQMLQQGGNAVDAAVAAAWTAGVVEPWMSGVGGVGAAVVHFEGRQWAIDFGLRAPMAAAADMFKLEPNSAPTGQWGWPPVINQENELGHRSVGVPGVVGGLLMMHESFGKLPRPEVMRPAIEHARNGFDVDWHTTLMISLHWRSLMRFAPAGLIFLKEDNSIPLPSVLLSDPDVIRQTELAQTLAEIAVDGADAFYRGGIARRIVDDMHTHGGLIALADLSEYKPEVFERPARSMYRTLEIVRVPGVAGGQVVEESLSHIFQSDIRSAGATSAENYHILASAFNRAYSGHLVSPEDANEMGSHTTHLCAVDRSRNAVSLTQTLGHLFGSTVVVPGTGVLLNDMMILFDPRPGRPNSVSGGAPQATPVAPLLMLRDGSLYAALGAPGGRRIPTSLVQVIVNLEDHQMPIEDAIDHPRVHAEGDEVLVDSRLGADLGRSLEGLGHRVVMGEKTVVSYNFAQPNAITVQNGALNGGTDPYCPAAAVASAP